MCNLFVAVTHWVSSAGLDGGGGGGGGRHSIGIIYTSTRSSRRYVPRHYVMRPHANCGKTAGLEQCGDTARVPKEWMYCRPYA